MSSPRCHLIQLDIQPTALAAAGGSVKPEWKLDGVNLLPYRQAFARGSAQRGLNLTPPAPVPSRESTGINSATYFRGDVAPVSRAFFFR